MLGPAECSTSSSGIGSAGLQNDRAVRQLGERCRKGVNKLQAMVQAFSVQHVVDYGCMMVLSPPSLPPKGRGTHWPLDAHIKNMAVTRRQRDRLVQEEQLRPTSTGP